MNPIRVVGVGEVTLDELKAMLVAYLNAGAPKPVLECSHPEREMILSQIAADGDSQMKALVESLLRE